MKPRRVIQDIDRPQMERVPRFPLDKRCQWANIFDLIDSDFRMPETVYVVAAGPNGRQYLDKIPKDAYTIAVNSLICHGRAWDWWIAFDHRIVWMDWWPSFTIDRDRTKVLFGTRLVNMLCMYPGQTYGRATRMEPDYVFEYMNRTHNNIVAHTFKVDNTKANGYRQVGAHPVLIPGLLRGGLTVSGIAIQLAYYCGAKNIVTVGMDFSGQEHWDGFKNPSHLYKGTWIWKEIVNNFCEYLREHRGTTVYTVSDSALSLPRWTL